MTTDDTREGLRRELEVTKRPGLVLLPLVAFVAVTGACTRVPRENVIRARRFEVVDASGKPRIVLGVTEDGPLLGLSDANDKPRIGLGVTEAGAVLGLLDANGKTIWAAR